MIIRLPRLQLGNFVTSGAKRLLQHNRRKADIPTAPAFVRYWATADNGGFWPAMVCPLMTQSGHHTDVTAKKKSPAMSGAF
jgi:hypothetical protein